MTGTPMQSQEFVWDQNATFEDWCKKLNGEGWYLNAQAPRREEANGSFVYTFLQLVPAQAHTNLPHIEQEKQEN